MSTGAESPEVASRRTEKPRGKRSKHGCATCRIRRIKCDETQPRCLKCESRGYECMWSEKPATSLPSAASLGLITRGQKTAIACAECRKRKTRCSGPTKDHSPCDRCARRSLSCEWSQQPSSKRRYQTSLAQSDSRAARRPSLSPVSVSSSHHTLLNAQTAPRPAAAEDPDLLATALTSRVELIAMVRMYFGTVHQHGYLGFLHEPTIMRLIDQNRAPRQLLWLIVANSMRYARNESSSVAWSRGDELAFSAFRSLESQVHDNVGAIHLMAVILAHHHEYGRGRFSSSWILAGNAVRIMQLLRLHILPIVYPSDTLSSHGLLSPEALRRLAWAVFYMDTMNDCGTYGMHTLTEDMLRIQLPCNEATFLRGDEVETEYLHPTGNPLETGHQLGVSAYIMRAAAMRRRILHFGSRLGLTKDTEDVVDREANLLDHDLQEVLSNLPKQLAYTRTNLFVLKDQNTAFILLHMLRQNCILMQLQARMAICERFSGRRAHLPSLWQGRIDTSLTISDIVCDALKGGVHCDTYVGVQAYGALEILLFDPLRLVTHGQSATDKGRYLSPIKILMQLIRDQSFHHATLFNLRLEASHRLIRCEMGNVLNEDDWSAYQCGYTPKDLGGEEYDFRAMDWYQDESRIYNGAVKETRLPAESDYDDFDMRCHQGTVSLPAVPGLGEPDSESHTLGMTRPPQEPIQEPMGQLYDTESSFAIFGDAVFPLWSR